MGAAAFVDEPSYRALILRRTFGDLSQLIERSQVLYRLRGGSYNKTDHLWTFPSGATIEFGHCEHDDDRFKYQGRQYSFLGIDDADAALEDRLHIPAQPSALRRWPADLRTLHSEPRRPRTRMGL